MKTWRGLHTVGTSKVVNTSFIWLALIPFLARCLDALHEGARLPFNFVAFYYAAFFFTLASLIFNLACPVIIKLAPTYGAFMTGGYSLLELKNWYHDMATAKDGKSRDTHKIQHFNSNLNADAPLVDVSFAEKETGIAGGNLLSFFWSCLPTFPDGVSRVHDLAIKEAETKNPQSLLFAFSFYCVGFVLFGAVALLNLWVVCKVSWQMLKAHGLIS